MNAANELVTHVRGEYERATELNAGHRSARELVTLLADYCSRAVHLSENAASHAIAVFIEEALADLGVPDLDGIELEASHVRKRLEDELREAAE